MMKLVHQWDHEGNVFFGNNIKSGSKLEDHLVIPVLFGSNQVYMIYNRVLC